MTLATPRRSSITRAAIACGRHTALNGTYRNKLEKFFVEPAVALAEPLPLGAVYALHEARPPHKAGIERKIAGAPP